jgi:hypothetical protein
MCGTMQVDYYKIMSILLQIEKEYNPACDQIKPPINIEKIEHVLDIK